MKQRRHISTLHIKISFALNTTSHTRRADHIDDRLPTILYLDRRIRVRRNKRAVMMAIQRCGSTSFEQAPRAAMR